MGSVFDVPALQNPDIGGTFLSALHTGQDRGLAAQERQTLSQIGGEMANGNLSGAANTAYRSGNLDAGLKISGMQDAKNSEAFAIIGKMAEAADTPEKWNEALGIWKKHFPNAPLEKFADFESGREMVLRAYGPAAQPKVMSAGSTLVDLNTGDPMYTAPAQPPKPPTLQAADKKAIYEAEDDIPVLQGTIEALDRALELNEKAFTGYTAGGRAAIGSNLPDGAVPDWISPKAGADATREFSQIMSKEAIASMSASLKGATTDFELRKFEKILSDPTTPTEIRKRTIERMKMLAERKLKINQARIDELKAGTYYQPDAPAAGQPPADEGNSLETIEGDVDPQSAIDQANEAISSGADPEAVKQRLRDMGIEVE